MISDPKIGDQVKLRSDSRWFDKGDNPNEAQLSGVIIGIDGHWIEVLWTGFNTEINYKANDLDPVV